MRFALADLDPESPGELFSTRRVVLDFFIASLSASQYGMGRLSFRSIFAIATKHAVQDAYLIRRLDQRLPRGHLAGVGLEAHS